MQQVKFVPNWRSAVRISAREKHFSWKTIKSLADARVIANDVIFIFFTLAVQHRIDVSDFEEHLGHGVGIRLLMLIQTMAVYCEEEGPQVEVEIYSV